jgi:cellulose synthase/poly-beta-1,6-N-acetylglucosamine synthase-like glycosyltransferase
MSAQQPPAGGQNPHPALTVVVIGRNEGMRLTACLESVLAMEAIEGGAEVIYVDSDSSDDSIARAEALGVKTIHVQPVRPTAAIGRNAGWRAAQAPLVLFLDGDTLLDPHFVNRAVRVFDDPMVAGVSGNRWESRPQDSVYNRVLDLDWRGGNGEVEYCGGDALIRREVLERVDGFDETLIAGEEPDMWRRIRALGFKAWRLDIPMTSHDLAMTRWSQYWRRATRTGYAYAEVSQRYRGTELPLWASTARRNRIHASLLLGTLAAAVLLSLLFISLWPIVLWLLLLVIVAVRTARRQGWRGGSPWTLFLYGLHSHLQQIPIFVGQLSYDRAKRSGSRRGLIEYKQ